MMLKYNDPRYSKVGDHIYKIYNESRKRDFYIISLSFEQEPELGEGDSSKNISQYPLEDILDKYYVAVEDFYEELNDGSSNTCEL